MMHNGRKELVFLWILLHIFAMNKIYSFSFDLPAMTLFILNKTSKTVKWVLISKVIKTDCSMQFQNFFSVYPIWKRKKIDVLKSLVHSCECCHLRFSRRTRSACVTHMLMTSWANMFFSLAMGEHWKASVRDINNKHICFIEI